MLKNHSIEIYGDLYFPKKIPNVGNKEKIEKYLKLAIDFTAYTKLDVNKSVFKIERKFSNEKIKEGLDNLIIVLKNISLYLYTKEELKNINENFYTTGDTTIAEGFDFSKSQNSSTKLSFIGALDVLYKRILRLASDSNIFFREPLFLIFWKKV